MENSKAPLVLVFGSSADPFHQGHAELVTNAARALVQRGYPVAEVIIMPVYRHHNTQDEAKRSLPLTYEYRYALCQIAAEQIAQDLAGMVPKITVSRLEDELVRESHRPNFTVETLAALRERLDPSQQMALLLGMDSFACSDPPFLNWYQWERLIRLAKLVICPRLGSSPNQDFIAELRKNGAEIIFLNEVTLPEISSAQIRRELEAGNDPQVLVERGWLSPAAADFLRQNSLIQIWRELDTSTTNPPGAEQLAQGESLEARVGQQLLAQKLTLALAESCTGGLVSHRITNVPGSSDYFIGGVVSYAYAAKVSLLGVKWETLQKYGAVSSQTVLEMARGVRLLLKTDIGLSVSCIAGPGGATPAKPVGTSWVGLATAEGEWSRHFLLQGDRLANKEALAEKALEMLLEYLEKKGASQNL
jgi:nicotinate (nicotinamide) nucleotide adenylyltransferase